MRVRHRAYAAVSITAALFGALSSGCGSKSQEPSAVPPAVATPGLTPQQQSATQAAEKRDGEMRAAAAQHQHQHQ